MMFARRLIRQAAACGFLVLVAWLAANGLVHAAHHGAPGHQAARAGHPVHSGAGDDFPDHGWHSHADHDHPHGSAAASQDAEPGGDWEGHPHYRSDTASRPRGPDGDVATPDLAVLPTSSTLDEGAAAGGTTLQILVSAPDDSPALPPGAPRAPPPALL